MNDLWSQDNTKSPKGTKASICFITIGLGKPTMHPHCLLAHQHKVPCDSSGQRMREEKPPSISEGYCAHRRANRQPTSGHLSLLLLYLLRYFPATARLFPLNPKQLILINSTSPTPPLHLLAIFKRSQATPQRSLLGKQRPASCHVT